jgi:glutamate N-acetyltransferase/amino-acid N-acetyltransferase
MDDLLMTDWHLARGYRYAGIHSGVRPERSRRDLALIVSDTPACAAGAFTQNRVRAAPVRICQERLPRADCRAIVICSGNANACTGDQGMQDARRMTEVAARELGCAPEQVLVASTGVIGRHLPMPALESGIPAAVPLLDASFTGLDHAAHAILTTDTRIKVSTRSIDIDGIEVRVTGFAKGAAMIGPNMATMLAFVCSDAAVGDAELHMLVRRAAAQTFNCVRVEGHTSTNDSLFLLANGQGRRLEGGALTRFGAAVTDVCADLARAIAADAEGATHLVTIDVEGLRDDAEARKIAQAVSDSALVKTAIYGSDPNWGRIVSAAGYAGVPFEEHDLSLWLGDLLLYERGTPRPFDPATASSYLKKNREVYLRLRFTLGDGRSTVWTSDLTVEYVRLNADYTT